MTTLVPAPNLEQIKKQAKDLLRAFRANDPQAAARFRSSHPELESVAPERLAAVPLQLADAQLVLAREYGFPSWPKLKQEIERRSGQATAQRSRVRRENGRAWIDGVARVKWGSDRETTLCGALESALAVTEHPYTYVQLMGYSGLAFRTRWWQGNESPDCCPSSPVGEFPEEMQAITRATGWPMWTGNRLGDEEGDRSMAGYWQEIVSTIDDGRPALAYALKMDLGVIHGYVEEEKSVLAWDYFQEQDEPITLPIDKLGPMIIFFDDNEGPADPRDAFLSALRMAVSNFRRDKVDRSKPGDYRYGERAYAGWADDLAAADPAQGDYYAKLFHASWWTFDCLFDARAAAPTFLRSNADRLPKEAAGHLHDAAALYEQEKDVLDRSFMSRDVFLGPWTGKSIADWTPDMRRAERDVLDAAAQVDRKAVAAIATALDRLSD
jgi:hypothetical protein